MENVVAVVRIPAASQLIGSALGAVVFAGLTPGSQRAGTSLVAVEIGIIQRQISAIAQSIVDVAGLVIVELIVGIVGGCGRQAGKRFVILQNFIVIAVHRILLYTIGIQSIGEAFNQNN